MHTIGGDAFSSHELCEELITEHSLPDPNLAAINPVNSRVGSSTLVCTKCGAHGKDLKTAHHAPNEGACDGVPCLVPFMQPEEQLDEQHAAKVASKYIEACTLRERSLGLPPSELPSICHLGVDCADHRPPAAPLNWTGGSGHHLVPQCVRLDISAHKQGDTMKSRDASGMFELAVTVPDFDTFSEKQTAAQPELDDGVWRVQVWRGKTLSTCLVCDFGAEDRALHNPKCSGVLCNVPFISTFWLKKPKTDGESIYGLLRKEYAAARTDDQKRRGLPPS